MVVSDKHQQTSSEGTRFLVTPRSDPWLVGGAGIIVWFVLSAQQWGGPTIDPLVSGPIYWVLLGISGTHFGASYHLAYGQGREIVFSRWIALIAVPAVLVGLSIVIAAAATIGADTFVDESVRFLLATVYTLTGWHFVKQVYGVARVAASLNGLKIPEPLVPLLRYGLYPVWFLEAARVWTGDPGTVFDRFETSYSLLPPATIRVISVLTFACAVGAIVVFVEMGRTWRRRPPAAMWTPYAVAFLFFLFPPSYVGLVLVFGALHGLQYLACAHRAEMVWGRERGAEPKTWWVSTFGGAFATGMLLVYWLPEALTSSAGTNSIGTTPAALLFVVFNLHHYSVDASIWRFGGDQIRRIVKGDIDPSHSAQAPGIDAR